MASAAGRAYHPSMRTVLLLLPLLAVLSAAPAPAGSAVKGRTVARVSVTVDPDGTGTIQVPSPFTVIPGSGEVAINVPESGGILLLAGERIVHHFPLMIGFQRPLDLESDGALLVSGSPQFVERTTAQVAIFDLASRRIEDRIWSANPYLRIGFEATDLWRIVVEDGKVGVYQPKAGATYPLWIRGSGALRSEDQVTDAVAGIGFASETRMIPDAAGNVTLRRRASAIPFATPEDGEFLDAGPNESALFLQPTLTVRSDSNGDFLLPHEIATRLIDTNGNRTDFLLDAIDTGVKASRLVIQGRPVRVRGDTVYWIFLGADFLEIRGAKLREIAAIEG